MILLYNECIQNLKNEVTHENRNAGGPPNASIKYAYSAPEDVFIVPSSAYARAPVVGKEKLCILSMLYRPSWRRAQVCDYIRDGCGFDPARGNESIFIIRNSTHNTSKIRQKVGNGVTLQ